MLQHELQDLIWQGDETRHHNVKDDQITEAECECFFGMGNAALGFANDAMNRARLMYIAKPLQLKLLNLTHPQGRLELKSVSAVSSHLITWLRVIDHHSKLACPCNCSD
jgi:hypothetical protein